MRKGAFAVALLLLVLTSGPVMTQPFGPLGPRQPVVLNGCTENAIFAVMNTAAGQECLKALPRFSNVGSEFSLFCKAGRWGCCLKSTGFGACKIEETIPYRRRTPPVATPD
jgi:hypothetical protein